MIILHTFMLKKYYEKCLIINVENSRAAFCGNKKDSLINIKFKRTLNINIL